MTTKLMFFFGDDRQPDNDTVDGKNPAPVDS